MDSGIRSKEKRVVIQVRVKPNSRESTLQEQPDGTWTARLKSRPVDGKANEELIRLIAQRFGCSRSSVSIRSGATARIKLIEVTSE
jgi:uncharacterized protein (TIGR00251 family)